MKTLVLMRHCKSDWGHGVPDLERPLNARGRKSAKALGDWLRQNDVIANEIMCSTATRTFETCKGLGVDTSIDLYRELYLADADTMLTVLSGAQEECVLMVGHNGGIAEFAGRLVKEAPRHDRFEDYPTGATTVITFDADAWSDVRWKKGTAISFAIPRELY